MAAVGAEKVDDTELLCKCRGAGDAVPLFVKMGEIFAECENERWMIDQKITEVFNDNQVDVTVRIKRIYTILLLFSLKVKDVG